MRQGYQFDQVFVANVVFGQKSEMESFGVYVRPFIKTRAGGDVGLYADNRFDAVRFAGLIKFYGAMEVAMVGNGKRRHAVFFGQNHHLVYFGHAVQKRVVGVSMQMDEFRFHDLQIIYQQGNNPNLLLLTG